MCLDAAEPGLGAREKPEEEAAHEAIDAVIGFRSRCRGPELRKLTLEILHDVLNDPILSSAPGCA